MPSSSIKAEIAKILKDEGFLESFEVVDGEKANFKVLRLKIKYIGERRERKPVLSGIERVAALRGAGSTPIRRKFPGCYQA